MDYELYFRMPVGSQDYKHTSDESDVSDANPTTSQGQRAATELERFDLETSDVDGYAGKDSDDADADEEEKALQATDGSTQNVGNWGHSRFQLGTSNVDGYEGKDGDDVDVDEKREASQADDGSMQNVEDWGHSRFDQGTSTVDWYEGKNGNDADADEEDDILQADDELTPNVEDSGYSTRKCEDWTVYFRPVKYDNGEGNATASDVSKAKTVL